MAPCNCLLRASVASASLRALCCLLGGVPTSWRTGCTDGLQGPGTHAGSASFALGGGGGACARRPCVARCNRRVPPALFVLPALPALLFLEEAGLTEDVGLGTAADAARGDAGGIIGPKPGGLIGTSGACGTAGGSGGKAG